ncbi:hypothetical protein [Beggiatoa leptomitoformis]|uniref:Phage capsid protein n=1 Tax=Beggiatoa leptomitoformis TaxID=288004 RepID=A0A2N9YH24_9GAMM|nr:hypothetical protein [Beggiatoa leptomitoformis]ALG67878.1 phage capsid protein [Beggiatoa leptomitoformis]AUI69861.1 phage capsid protein [Beggiatoa leptomitoformis]
MSKLNPLDVFRDFSDLGNYPVDSERLPLVIAYSNRKFIADMVLPRVTPVSRQSYDYIAINRETAMRIPDTRTGRTSEPNIVELKGEEKTGKTEPHYIGSPVPQADIDNAGREGNPLDRAAEAAINWVLLDREKRVADMVFNASTYVTGQKETLTGTDQWSNAASLPVQKIGDALDKPIYRPNTMVIGRAAWSKLSRNPEILKAVHGNEGGSGIARVDAVRELFELDNIIIGDSFYNAAPEGLVENMTRLWGKHCALIYVDPRADTTKSGLVTFGFTVSWGTRQVKTVPVPTMGGRGGYAVYAGEDVDENIICPDVGYLFTNCVA